ncbi:MAG: hypothetical protein PX481_18030 [Microcystis sp. M53603_WE2]|nr:MULTISPECIES: hypothetical protein [unclassified Microcystis]MCZ8028566.1 hypothetical protein [Microcystis sp. LE19-10.1B]MDJ0540538.1 hypothetical protein [Microcystis sp. M53603_WE2]MDJ0606842.1 hypothetical protein [Microcystis sp. M53602_WE12]
MGFILQPNLRSNQLSLLPDKDLVDLCHPIEPYQVTKNPFLALSN